MNPGQNSSKQEEIMKLSRRDFVKLVRRQHGAGRAEQHSGR